MRFTTKAVATVLALACSSNALKATILADTNRDGKIDSGDHEGRNAWTTNRGALILANIGDTDERCSKKITDDTPDEEIDQCNDAEGEEQRNAKYLAPLKTVPISTLSSSATGTLHVENEAAVEKIRIFVKKGSGWTFVSSNHNFTAAELKEGLELGVDARDVRRPSGWDGRATVIFSVADGTESARDEVALRVAPILTHHHVQEATRVFTTVYDGQAQQEQFVADLKNHTAAAGIEEEVYGFTKASDIWTQDFFEPGYTSIPGPDGPIVLRVMIRSAQSYRKSGRQIFTELRSASVGAVQDLREGESIDSTGNLETIPPYELDGKSYPAGRVVMGRWEDIQPHIIPFFQAQEVQDPVLLDTQWLAVGHVDEFLQFLPYYNERGWIAMIDDPLQGLELLEEARKSGHGSDRAWPRPKFDYDENLCVTNLTLDELFAKPNFTDNNENAARKIQGNIDILKKETGITDDEIIRLPALFYYYDDWADTSCPGSKAKTSSSGSVSISGEAILPLNQLDAGTPLHSRLSKRQNNGEQYLAKYPGTINGVVLSDSYVLAPNPWGPIVDGKDIIAERVKAAYAKANYTVHFMDDYFSHHILGGEVHCGSNTWRKADTPWW